MGQLPRFCECQHPYFIHALLSVHVIVLCLALEKLWRVGSELALIHLLLYTFFLWTAKMEIWKANCYFHALENEAHTGNNFWENSNRQKLSERMHRTPSCFKFFQMSARCPYPYITEWIKARFYILGIKSLADILYIMQHFNIHLEIPRRSASECCLLQVHTRFSPFYLSLLCPFFKNVFMKIVKDFPNVCFHLSLSPLLQKLLLLCSEKIHIGRNGRKKFLPIRSEGELASLVLEVARG